MEKLGCVNVTLEATCVKWIRDACAADTQIQIQDRRGLSLRKGSKGLDSGDWSKYNGIRTDSGCMFSVIGVATGPAK